LPENIKLYIHGVKKKKKRKRKGGKKVFTKRRHLNSVTYQGTVSTGTSPASSVPKKENLQKKKNDTGYFTKT